MALEWNWLIAKCFERSSFTNGFPNGLDQEGDSYKERNTNTDLQLVNISTDQKYGSVEWQNTIKPVRWRIYKKVVRLCSKTVSYVLKLWNYLTHLLSMHPFSTPWKHQKTVRFSAVFSVVEKGCIGNKWVNVHLKRG